MTADCTIPHSSNVFVKLFCFVNLLFYYVYKSNYVKQFYVKMQSSVIRPNPSTLKRKSGGAGLYNH